ncbi:unnamed protein product [Blepharisma stoltei]|uniref:Uncharacterized protein n=1 Tax=Blepharisma stoltei TaxID=1481888 RepID=A0AAU9JNB9_9CILI|nr:unnamed protein product [Blepharisma stoltei]
MKTYLPTSQTSSKKIHKIQPRSKLKTRTFRYDRRFPPKAPHNTTQYLIEKSPQILWDPDEIIGTMIYSNKLLLNKIFT